MRPTPPLTVNIEQTARLLAQRQLGSAALLFLAGHRPLAFVGGQFLHMLTPFAELIGFGSCDAWAQILSDDDYLDQLEGALTSDEPLLLKNARSADLHNSSAPPTVHPTQNSPADHVA